MKSFYGVELTKNELDFALSYFECMLWADEPEGAGMDLSDLEPDYLRGQLFECIAFYLKYEYVLSDEIIEQAGHDLWLSRQGHGAGFWDRGDTYKMSDSGYDFSGLLNDAAQQLGYSDLEFKAESLENVAM